MSEQEQQNVPPADDPTRMTDFEGLADLEAMDPPPGAGGAAPDDEPGVETAAVIRGLMEPTFLIIAPNWKLQSAELDALSMAYADVLDKYFPDGIGNMPEVTAALLTVGVFLPRLRSGVPPRGEVIDMEGSEPGKPDA